MNRINAQLWIGIGLLLNAGIAKGLVPADRSFDEISSEQMLEDIIENNLGQHLGKQVKDGILCRFKVAEISSEDFLMSATFQKPTRLRSVRYPAGANSFKLDSSKGILIFDKTGSGKPNLIYTFDPETLKMQSVEEAGMDICQFK